MLALHIANTIANMSCTEYVYIANPVANVETL